MELPHVAGLETMIQFQAISRENIDESKLRFSLENINRLRADYKHSKHEYNADNIENTFIIFENKQLVGFIEAELRNANLISHLKISFYIHFLHILEAKRNSGVGFRVLNCLLAKGADLEFVVVNSNAGMLRLVNHFKHISSGEKCLAIRIAQVSNL